MSVGTSTLQNMYRLGLIKNEGDTNMSTYTTYDKQYKIELKRENIQLWFTDNNYKFKCNIDIYDNITNRLLVHLNCNENDIMNLLDCYTQMNDFGIYEIVCPPLSPYNANGNYYFIELDMFRINPISNVLMDISNRWIVIKEYNPLLEQVVDILEIQMDNSELEEFMDLLYFVFLIDQDNYGIVPMDDIYPRE